MLLEILLTYTLIYVILCCVILGWFRAQGGDWVQMWFWYIVGVFPLLYFTWPLIIPMVAYEYIKKWLKPKRRKKR